MKVSVGVPTYKILGGRRPCLVAFGFVREVFFCYAKSAVAMRVFSVYSFSEILSPKG